MLFLRFGMSFVKKIYIERPNRLLILQNVVPTTVKNGKIK